MKVISSFSRRALLGVAAAGLLAAQAPALAQAAKFPDRPVKLIVTYPPGGSSDLMARVMGQKMSEIWGQPVIIESKPGAAGSIGMEFAARQPNDGYTFVIGNLGPAGVNPLLQKLPYSMDKDFISVSLTATGANILVVPANSPYKSVKDIIADAKANPGKISFGTSGPGSMSHLAAELMMRQSGIKMVAIPYKGGGQAVTDVLAGQLPMIISDALPVSQHIASGKLRALAITSEKRSPLFPEIPTFAEAGLDGMVALNWWGLFLPAGTPQAIVDNYNATLNKAMVNADLKDRFNKLGVEPHSSTPAEFRAFLANEKVKYSKLIADNNIKADQ
ncbi:MAG: tripartite tricarboxylate transporter substrate binding protein [Alphaproteobacteria bacterium]|nr:tripartite tricarboxylate transporter substrate binding protein [Alphaproteobacteria bacterium]